MSPVDSLAGRIAAHRATARVAAPGRAVLARPARAAARSRRIQDRAGSSGSTEGVLGVVRGGRVCDPVLPQWCPVRAVDIPRGNRQIRGAPASGVAGAAGDYEMEGAGEVLRPLRAAPCSSRISGQPAHGTCVRQVGRAVAISVGVPPAMRRRRVPDCWLVEASEMYVSKQL